MNRLAVTPTYFLFSLFLVLFGGLPGLCDDSPADPAGQNVSAQDQLKTALEQRGFQVLAAEPGTETPADWSPVSAETLLGTTADQLRSLASERSFATLESAVFSATFSGGDLRQGQFSGVVAKVGPAAALLDWTGTNIDLHGLVEASENSQQATPATWGTAPDGRAVVVIHETETTLRGEWSARGETSLTRDVVTVPEDAPRQVLTGTHFDLNLPPALHAQLKLRVPSGQRVTASAGLLTGPQPSQGKWNIWTLDLGRRHEVRITIDELPLLPSQPLLLGKQETAYSAQQNGLTMQVDIGLEVFSASVSSLQIQVPEDIEIQGASINNIPVPVQHSAETPGRVVILCGELPLEQFSLLRVSASQGPQWDRVRPLPKLIFPEIHLTQERVTLFVEAPLAVRSVVPHALVQTGLSRDGPGELWTFQSLEPIGQLLVEIGRPQADIEATLRAVAALQLEAPSQVVQVQLRSNSGSQFSVTFRVPSGWAVLDVVGTGDSTLPVTWMVEKRAENSLLHVEFARPLAAGAEKSLQVLLRGDPISLSQPLAFPVIQPLVKGVVSGTCQLVMQNDFFVEPLSESSSHSHIEPAGLLKGLWNVLTQHELELPQLEKAGITEFRWGTTGDPRPDRLRFVAASGMSPDEDMMLQQSRGPMAVTPGDSEKSPVESSEDISNLPCSLDLTTVLAPRGGATHMQRIVYEYPVPVPVRDLSLNLTASCSVSAVAIDGENVTVLRRGDSISFPEQLTTVQRLEMTYIVPSKAAGIWREIELPLPEILGAIDRFEWRVEVPTGYELSPLDLPSSLTNVWTQVPLTSRVLGPLARSARDGVFHPFRIDDWRSLWSPAPAAESVIASSNEVHLLALSPPQHLRLICWDKIQLRTLAWAALLASALTGVGIRMWNIGWLRRLSILWLAVLAVTALLLPPVTSIVAGGAFVGSLLSLLLPRRLVQKTDLLNQYRELNGAVSANQVAMFVVGASLLCSSGFLLAQPSSSGVTIRLSVDADGKPVCELPQDIATQLKAHSAAIPQWLIRSADYTVTFADIGPVVHANYAVQILDPARAQAIRLPLASIVLPNGASCLVDGEPAQLIPAVDGSGLIVSLPAPKTLDEQPQATVLKHIELDFSIRPDATGRLQALIPPVLNSQAEVLGRTAMGPLVRQGMIVNEGDNSERFYLGGVPQLLWPVPVVSTEEDTELKAQSLVHVTAMQLSVTSVLSLPASTETVQRVLQLPSKSIIRNVQGATGTEWGIIAAGPRGTLLRVVSPSQPAMHSLRLEYELLPNVDEGQSVRLPSIPLIAEGLVIHEIGFTAGPGWNLGLPVSSGAGRVELVPQSERTGLLLTSAGIQQSIRMTSPQVLSLPLIPIEQVSTASIMEQCHVQRSQLEWEAQFEISTGPLPQFVHRLKVSPDWRVREVKVEQMGVTQPVRWDQRGTDLTAFLDDQGLGTRKLIVICSRALPTELWTEFPRLELVDVQVQERQLSVLDETNWIVEVETNGGSVMATPAALPPANNADEPGLPRASRLQFRGAGVSEPRRLRIVPSPDAARAETVLSLQPAAGSGWRMTQMIHVEALDAPLKRIQLLVPNELADKLSLYPASLRRSMSRSEQESTTLTLFVPTRLRDAITFSLAYDVDDETATSRVVPVPEVISADQGLRLLVLDTATGLRVPAESGLAISGAALPAWSPRPWLNAVRSRDAVCYQLSKAPLKMSRRENIVQDTHLPWAEHLIWIRPDGRLTGQTQLWGISHEQVALQLLLPQHVTINSVHSETSVPLLTPLEEGSSHRRVILPDVDGLFDFTIHWQSDEPLQSIVPLPQFAPLQPKNSVVGIVRGDGWEAVPASSMRQMTVSDVWLARWNGLLDCLDEAPTVLSVESPVMHRIRRQQQEAKLASESSEDAFRRRFGEAQNRWDRLQGELLIDADQSQHWRTEHDNLGTALTLRDPSVQWFELHEPVTAISIRPMPEKTRPTALWLLLGLIAVSAVGLKVLTDRFRIRERLAIRPALGIMLMGVIWWSWLYPSVFGLLIFLCGLAMLAHEFLVVTDDTDFQTSG